MIHFRSQKLYKLTRKYQIIIFKNLLENDLKTEISIKSVHKRGFLSVYV